MGNAVGADRPRPASVGCGPPHRHNHPVSLVPRALRARARPRHDQPPGRWEFSISGPRNPLHPASGTRGRRPRGTTGRGHRKDAPQRVSRLGAGAGKSQDAHRAATRTWRAVCRNPRIATSPAPVELSDILSSPRTRTCRSGLHSVAARAAGSCCRLRMFTGGAVWRQDVQCGVGVEHIVCAYRLAAFIERGLRYYPERRHAAALQTGCPRGSLLDEPACG